MKMTTDIRELRVELKKVEADRDREKLEGRLAQIEVELQESVHARIAAESSRNVAQDALAKAEVARHKAAEEALSAAKARDAASTGGDDARRELEKLRKKVAELESKAPPPAVDPKELQLEREASERKLKEALDNASTAERSLKALQAEVDAAKTDAAKARAEAARARAAADAQAVSVLDGAATAVTVAPAGPASGNAAEIARL